MNRFLLVAIAILSFPAFLSAQPLLNRADHIITLSQQLIVLSELPQGNLEKEGPRRTTAGLVLAHERRENQEKLRHSLLSHSDSLALFLDYLEDTTGKWDVDKLAFKQILEELEEEGNYKRKLSNRLAEDIEDLNKIERLYEKELEGIFGKTQKRGMVVRRKRWGAYLKYIQEKHNGETLLEQNAPEDKSGPKGKSGTRGAGKKAIWGYKVPAKTLILTFDDGPHYKNTPQILEVLKARGIPAIFFEVGSNIGTENKEKELQKTSAAKYSIEISNSLDHVLGNHSLTHAQLTKLDSAGIVTEVDETYRRLRDIAGDKTVFFRPPYGAFNDQVRAILKDRNTLPYMWNIDSEDWADPVPTSIASRVVAEVETQGRGVILMHDIHSQTVKALPMMLDTLLAKGYKFALWDGEKVISKGEEPKGDPPVAVRGVQQQTDNFYRKRWALVVGVNDYAHWPKLQYAVNDAEGIKETLVDKLNFQEENVFLLTDGEATRKNILKVVGSTLANPDKVHEDDAIFVFFAGHGMTRALPSKRNLGYIIPADAEFESYSSSAISMTEIQDLNEMLPAKHVFWVMDACYSGLALTRGGLTNHDAKRYINEVTSRHARQMLTAGGAEEEVADGGPNGHSIFTWTLINGMKGDADLNRDGYISASEIFNYVPPSVSSLSRQTPSYGSLVGSAGGDFIFTIQYDDEILHANSEQHDDKTVALLNEIEELRRKLANMETRLHSKAEAGEVSNRGADPTANEETVWSLNKEGLSLFRKKEYAEALEKFKAAVEKDPSNVQAVNNLGFLYYKINNYPMAEIWVNKALEIAPDRGVAYLNLADIQKESGNLTAAIENYEKYISLVKESDYTRELMEEIQEMKKRR